MSRAFFLLYGFGVFLVGFFLVLFEVPWCASWPFSASSVWCVSCCLDLKAPASSAAPSTAVVWHVCKHTNTRVSQQTSTSRKVRRHLHKQTVESLSLTSLKGRNKYCSSYTLECRVLLWWKTEYYMIWVDALLVWFHLWLWGLSVRSCVLNELREIRVLLVTHVQKLCRGSGEPRF